MTEVHSEDRVVVMGEPGDWVVLVDGAPLERFKYRADATGYVEAHFGVAPPVIVQPGVGLDSGIIGRRQ